jgi:catechol 2,3-dioxygenase-like lactoylglutathione lyase family enzyme
MTSHMNSAISLAHLRLSVTDLAKAISFFEAIGARADAQREGFAVVELRDHTRLQLIRSEQTIAPGNPLQFDFKVEDIDAAWQAYKAKGLNPTEILRRNPGHDSFTLNGPDGCEIKINSTFNRG